jgi:hypothetical protein
MAWIVIVAIVVIGWLLWNLFARFAGPRGWIYHRKHNPRPEGLTSLGLLEEIYQPSIRYVVDEIAEEKARGGQAESGDKPFEE